MSGENDDLFSPSDALSFADITDNGDDLDFTKSIFSSDISTFNELNTNTYEGMEDDDLIAGLSGQDDFSRLGTAELSDSSSFEVEVEDKAALAATSQSLAHSSPVTEEQVLPSYANFQKPSINLAHINPGYGGSTGVQDVFLANNSLRVLPSPTSPANPLKSGSMLSPGATSEKLNCLSLEQVGYSQFRPSFEVSKGITRSYGMNGGRASPVGGEKRFCSSPLSSPTVQSSTPRSNSGGMSPFASSNGHEIAGGEAMQSLSPQSMRAAEVGSPRGLVNGSVDTKDGVEGLIVSEGMKIQGTKSIFLTSSGIAHRLSPSADSSEFVPQIDANGDGLRPLPANLAARPPIMQRSYSSHALGQLRSLAPSAQNSDQSTANFHHRVTPMDTPSRLSNGSSSPHIQPQLPDLQNVHMRPLLQSMRRVHSTGDIQTLNGMAGGGSSPSSLDRSFEDGGFKIGRYTVEERKIRIHRYQQKRTQRNFNKKIKYACRKTLADSRPRVRGRFAKNDEVGELFIKAKHEDEDEEEEDVNFDEENSYIEDEPLGALPDFLGPNGVKLEHPQRRVLLSGHQFFDKKLLQKGCDDYGRESSCSFSQSAVGRLLFLGSFVSSTSGGRSLRSSVYRVYNGL